MKDHLASLLKSTPTPIHGRNLVREYLQARILGSLQRRGAMIPLAFHGGTALRFLYNIPRHSEDLDFTLERKELFFDFHAYLKAIHLAFEREGYSVTLKINDKKTVYSAFVRFHGLLYELDLTPHQDQVFSVKIEVDTNPPGGAVLTTSVVRRHVILQLHHHNQSTLLAGKIHAILQRDYPKGRDLYDLLWYLSAPDWPEPNMTLLNNALRQTGWSGDALMKETWRKILSDRVLDLEWDGVRDDLLPFLEDADEVGLLSRDNLLRLLE